MTDAGFNEQYQLLAKHIPWQFGSQQVCDALSKEVGGLSYEWFQKTVARILLTHTKGNYNIHADIKAEKTRLAQEFSTSEQAKDFADFKRNSTEFGLESLKRKHGAQDIWDLVTKMKGRVG